MCGLIITGSDAICHPAEEAQLAELVRSAKARNITILALSNASPIALDALGFEPRAARFGVLIHREEITELATQRDADRAIDAVARSPNG